MDGWVQKRPKICLQNEKIAPKESSGGTLNWDLDSPIISPDIDEADEVLELGISAKFELTFGSLSTLRMFLNDSSFGSYLSLKIRSKRSISRRFDSLEFWQGLLFIVTEARGPTSCFSGKT